MKDEKDKDEYMQVEAVGTDRWSHWMLPSAEKPLEICCCDCGLTHQFEFGTVNMNHQVGEDGYRIKHLNSERVIFRSRVNHEETALARGNKQ